jgi:hypothetical protein
MPETTILSDNEVAEVAAMFPHAEYQPTLSPDEVDPCEFCKGTIDDHKANCVVPHVHALCQTVRALRAEQLEGETCELCDDPTNDEKGNPLTFLICGRCWNKNVEVNRQTITGLRDELAALTQERDTLREQSKGDSDAKR